MSTTPKPRHSMAAIPDSSHVRVTQPTFLNAQDPIPMTTKPEPCLVMAAKSKHHQNMAATPQSSAKKATMPGSSAKMAATPEPLHIVAAQFSPEVFFGVYSTQAPANMATVFPSQAVPEFLPLSSMLPVVAASCVFGAHTHFYRGDGNSCSSSRDDCYSSF